jgi:phenylpropionate dioxygenase-like ring-hydroxylating dioxygenase large terminal subunit
VCRFVDPAFHELDLRSVFTRNWLAVGCLDQVKEPGQFFTGEDPRDGVVMMMVMRRRRKGRMRMVMMMMGMLNSI